MKLYFSSTNYNELISTKDRVLNILDDDCRQEVEYYYNDDNYNNLNKHLTTFYIISSFKDEIFDKSWRLICVDLENKTSEMFSLEDPIITKALADAKKLAMLL